jgi:hypothetical protein
MRVFLIGINTLAAVVSLIWLWGHSSAPTSDWEFWFAFGYLVVAAGNLFYFYRRNRRGEFLADPDEA